MAERGIIAIEDVDHAVTMYLGIFKHALQSAAAGLKAAAGKAQEFSADVVSRAGAIREQISPSVTPPQGKPQTERSLAHKLEPEVGPKNIRHELNTEAHAKINAVRTDLGLANSPEGAITSLAPIMNSPAVTFTVHAADQIDTQDAIVGARVPSSQQVAVGGR